MSNIINVAKNFIVLSLSQILTTILSFVLVILITRYIGEKGYGELSFAMSLVSILTILTPLGFNSLIIREVARNKDSASKLLGNTLIIELLMSVLAFIFITVAVHTIQQTNDSTVILYLFGVYYVLSFFSNAMACVFSAYEKMEYNSLLNFIKIFMTVIIGACIILFGYGIVALLFAYLAAAVLEFILSICITVKKFIRPTFQFDISFWKRMIPIALPFAAFSLLATTYTQIDIVILKTMQNNATVGWYKAATMLVYSFSVIPSILSSSIFPAMSRFHVSSKELMALTVQKSTKYLLVLAFPITFGIMLLAEPIIILFYGEDFIPALHALRILSFYIPFNFLNIILGMMLASADKQRLRLFIYIGSTITRIMLLFILVPYMSLTGAAIAAVSSEIILLFFNYMMSRANVSGSNFLSNILKPLIAGAGMGVFIYLLKDMNLILLMILGAIVYFAALIMIKGLDKNDKDMILEILRGIKGA